MREIKQSSFKDSEFYKKVKNSSRAHKERDVLGTRVSYSLVALDVFLVAVRMFNKNAAEAMMQINDVIWGTLTEILGTAGDWCSKIPVIGKLLDALFTGLSMISDNLLTLFNFLPSVLYNFWEILFWVFIIITLLKVIPDILGRYAVERRYIAARYEEMARVQNKKVELQRNEKETLRQNAKDVVTPEAIATPLLECKTREADALLNDMEVFNDKGRKEGTRVLEE